MANLNKVMIIGNLTADPEVRTLPSGNSLTELRLAVNRQFSGQNDGERREETTFLDVTCWGRTGEIAAQYLAKGRPVFIEGRLRQETWEDKQTGQRRSKITIVAENLQLLGSRDGGGQGGGGNYGNGGGYQQRGNGYGNNGGGYGNNNGGGYGGGYGNHGGNQGGGNYGNGGGYQQAPQGGYQQPAPRTQPQQPAPMPPAPMPSEADDDIPF